MKSFNEEEWFERGMEALGNGHVYLARTCFENAAQGRRHPAACSYLALCQAQTRGKFSDAIALARQAIVMEPDNPVFYQNLGQIYQLAGMRMEAVETLREGVRRGAGEAAIAELNRIGTRRPPVFRRFHRDHPLNKYVGKLLARLRLR